MSATTIKIDSDLRDRLNERARERGVPVGSFVEELFAAWLRDRRFEGLRDAMAATSPEDDASYRAETEAWDTIAWDRE